MGEICTNQTRQFLPGLPRHAFYDFVRSIFSMDCFERLFHMNGLTRRLKPGSVPTIWKKSSAELTTRERRKVSKYKFRA